MALRIFAPDVAQRRRSHHPSASVPPNATHWPELDALRAVAVVSVIVHHFNERLLPGGYLGVDIFFVISGYVITASLSDRPATSLFDFLSSFYARRIKRLVPALVTCVLVTGLLISFVDPNPALSLRTGLTSLFGLSNLYLLRQAVDYFGTPATLNAFTQTWSLGVEEQFYLLFPLVVWFTGFGQPHTGDGTRFVRLVGMGSVVSLVAFVYWSRPDSASGAFFLMPTRLWELGAGSLVFAVTRRPAHWWLTLVRRLARVLVVVVLLCVLWAPAAYWTYSTPVVVVLTALTIAAIRLRPGRGGILAHPAIVHLGRMSYSLYLWHWSVLVISRWTIGVHPWTAPFQLVAMLMLALVSFRYIEDPLRHAVWSPSRGRTVAYGVSAVVCAAGVMWLLAKPLERTLYAGTRPDLAASGVESLTNVYTLPGVSSWQGEKCVLSDNAQVGKSISDDDCTLGHVANAKHRVLVLGNSFLAAFVQAFDQLVLADHYAVTLVASWGASPVSTVPNLGPWSQANAYYWDEVVPGRLSQLRTGDWVLLMSDLADFSPPVPTALTEPKLSQLTQGLIGLSSRLSQRGVKLAVVHGNPFVREAHCDPASAMPQWFAPFGSPCRFYSRTATVSRRAGLDDVLSSLASRGYVTVIDLIDVFCPADRCTYEARNGQILYRDASSHPSVEAARLSAPIIRRALTASPASAP